MVILAAGESKRMGSPKQLLEWGNTTLLGHTIETALNLKAKKVIVVLGANFQAIKKEIEHYPITILNNKNWKKGLGKSLAFGIEFITSLEHNIDAVLVTLADQPLIDETYLNKLIELFNMNIVATSYSNKKVGVPAIFDKKYFKDLLDLKDDYGAKNILNKYKFSVKVLKPEIDNLDLDSKSDYSSLYKKTFDN